MIVEYSTHHKISTTVTKHGITKELQNTVTQTVTKYNKTKQLQNTAQQNSYKTQ